jgi:uncharacterized repeat protein (TIGR01451 family)
MHRPFKPVLARAGLILAALVVLLLVLPRSTVTAMPPAQNPIPHSIADHTDCLSCHGTGVAGAPQVPADHAGRTNETCTSCHQPAAPASMTTTSSTAATTAAPASATTSSPAVATAAPTTAPIAGMSLDTYSSKECQGCHPREWAEWSQSGHAMTLSAQLLNSDHDSSEQLDQTCVKCHSAELGTVPIGNIVQPVDMQGPWHLVGQYASLGDMAAIPCRACHQSHTVTPAGLLPGMDFADESTFYRGVPAPQVSNLYVYDAFAQKYVSPQPIAPVMSGDQAIPINDTTANRVCYTCHATERAESNLFEPNTPPSGDSSQGTGDDRTLTGVHQGLQCVDCHMPAGSHTFNPMSSCSQCHSPGTSAASLDYVTTVRTSYNDPSLSMLTGNMSPLNIHFLDKSQLWPPVVVSMRAEDTGQTVTYTILIHNLASWDMSNITVHGTIPAGSGYLDSWVLDRNNPGKFLGTDVQLDVGKITAGQTFGPVVYRVLKGTATDFTAHASIVWTQPMTGSANSPDVTVPK